MLTAQSHSTRDQSNGSGHATQIYPPKVISGPKSSSKVDIT